MAGQGAQHPSWRGLCGERWERGPPAAGGLQLLPEDFDLSVPPKTEALEDDNPGRWREIPPEKRPKPSTH